MASRAPSTSKQTKSAPPRGAPLANKPPRQPYQSGTRIKLLQPVRCCLLDGQNTELPDLRLSTRIGTTTWVAAGTTGVIRDCKADTDTVHPEHRGDPSHHVDENLMYTYTVVFAVQMNLEYLRSYPLEDPYLVEHNDIVPFDENRSRLPKFKPNEQVVTIKDVTLGKGNKVAFIPKGARLIITSLAKSKTGFGVHDRNYCGYHVKMFVPHTVTFSYIANFMSARDFSLS